MGDKYPKHGDRVETPVTVVGPIDVDVISSVLPTGAATAARQDTGNTSLADIDASANAIEASVASLDAKLTNPLPVSAASLPLPTGAATEASLVKLPLAQGSTTSGQSGPLAQGAVTTAAPSYTTAQTSPLSLDTTGALRATLKSAGTNAAAIPTTSNLMAGSDGTLLRPLATDNAGNQKMLFGDTSSVDAFGRLRVSNPDTIFDNNFRNSLQALLWSSSTATGGTVTHTPNSAAATLAVTTSNASSAIYQTRRYFPYNAGKSQLVIFTGIFGTAQANTRRRYGYFDASDGLFFEQNGTTVNVVRRTFTSGSTVDNTVAQASWNLDTLNGSGYSGYTLDLSKNNIFFIDFEWLGAGRIRMGVVIDGKIIYCHQFLNANALTVPYMRTGSLPLRAEITNTAGAAATASLIIVCQTVISEGGNHRYGTQRTSSRAFSLRTVTTSYVPVISIRLKSANITAVAKLIESGIFGSTADNLNFSIIVNPTLTGSTFAVTTDGETVEVDIAATATTGGTVISNQYVNAAGAAPSVGVISLESALNTWLGSDLAGAADIFTLAARCSTGTADVAGFLTWLEL